MQHTETYNLNLIETSDTFSPDPLNQNAQALEDALSDETDAREADVAALDARVLSLEGKHIKCGMYTINQNTVPLTIHLGFTPKAVFAFDPMGVRFGALYSGYQESPSPPAEIIVGGFRIKYMAETSKGMGAGGVCIYIALD